MTSGVEQQQTNIVAINKNLNAEIANLRNNFDDLNYSYEKMDEAFTSITNDFGQRIAALENIINGGSGNGGV